ncbi:MAG: hypothetical protein ABEJ64_00295 [Candidatus Nanohaloarchaea archaeon]
MKPEDVKENSERRTVESVDEENWKYLGRFYESIASEEYTMTDEIYNIAADDEEVLATWQDGTVELMGSEGLLDSSERMLNSGTLNLQYQREAIIYRARNALDEFSDLF